MELTSYDVLAMEAGRELDKLIAEKIFGKEFTSFPMGECFYDGIGWVKADQYSTDMSASWEIVSKFPLFMLERVEVFEGHVTVNATVYSNVDDEKPYTANASTAELAICRAALLTTLTEQEDNP